MEFNYTIDSEASEPIMLIDKHIGMDEEDGEGIMGDKFTRELMFLDSLGKKVINVWVHTPGGVVDDGEKIYNAILKCKTPVDTHNVGMCASIGLPIFLAGRNRYQMDFARNMTHPVAGGDKKSTIAYSDSVIKMLSTRSFLSEKQVTDLMNKTTWMNADESLALGLCTEITDSATKNINISTINSYKEYSKIVNKLIEFKKSKPMNKVTNKLNLVEGSNEDSIVNAIDTIEAKYKSAEIENKTKFDKMVDELASAKKSKEEAESKYNEYKAKFDEEDKKNKEKEEVLNKARATDFVKANVLTGRIANEVEIISHWTDQLTKDFDKNKVIVEKLPINKVAPHIVNKIEGAVREIPADANVPSIDLNNPNGFVAKMNAIISNKAKQRFS